MSRLFFVIFFSMSTLQGMQLSYSDTPSKNLTVYPEQASRRPYSSDLRLSYLYPFHYFMVQFLTRSNELKKTDKKAITYDQKVMPFLSNKERKFFKQIVLKQPQQKSKKKVPDEEVIAYGNNRKFFIQQPRLKKTHKKGETSVETLAAMMNDMSLYDLEGEDDDYGQLEEHNDIMCDPEILDKMDDFYSKAENFWKHYGHEEDVTLLWWEHVSSTWKWYGKELCDIDIPLIPEGFTLDLIRDSEYDNNNLYIAFICVECSRSVCFEEMPYLLYKRKQNKEIDKKTICKSCSKSITLRKKEKNALHNEVSEKYSLNELIEIARLDLIKDNDIIEDGIKKLCHDYGLDENFTNYHLHEKFVRDGIKTLYEDYFVDKKIVKGGIQIGDYVYPKRIVNELGKKWLESR